MNKGKTIKALVRFIMVIYLVIHVGFTLFCWFHLDETLFEFFTLDALGVLLLSVLSLLSITTVIHGFIYLKNDPSRHYLLYHVALLALITAMSGAYLANGMTTVWIFVEATTLAVAALIYHDRTPVALEATWKYIFVCSVGIALAYLGILFLGFTVHDARLLHLSFGSVTEIAKMANPLYLKIAFIFVLVGYSTKMGLFPMHTVTIDAHSVAPPPVSALISTTLMNVGFLAIYRVYTLFSGTPALSFMSNVLILAGVLSLLIAAGYMLKAKHLKRMLAYSSLENMGLVAIALGVGGYGYYAALLLIVLHSLAKSSLFYQMGQLSRILHTFRLDESGRYMKLYPAGAMVLMTGMICILAIPPSGMFISELMILRAMVVNGQWLVMALTVILLCYIIYAMSTRIMHVSFSSPRNDSELLQPGMVSSVETVSQFILLALVIMICFWQPPFLTDLISTSISSLPR